MESSPPDRAPHGLLIVDKPSGPTSHDIVARARRHFRTKAVGHAGTLDPMATGVLVLLFGEATKLSAHLTLDEKRYLATVRFGRATDTGDAEGTTTEEVPWTGPVDPSLLEGAMALERERKSQVPPDYSAISVGGVRAHRAARAGQPLELAPRPVEVRELLLRQARSEGVTVEMAVSKGYYVRSFARDLGASLGIPSHLEGLRRLASGPFTLDQATAWPPEPGVPFLSLEAAARTAFPCLVLSATGLFKAVRGQRLGDGDFAEGEPSSLENARTCAWMDEQGQLIALGQRTSADEHRVVRGFVNAR